MLDVVQAPVVGKKGRMMAHIQALVRPESLDAAITACFRETTTIGLRYHRVEGAVLDREVPHGGARRPAGPGEGRGPAGGAQRQGRGRRCPRPCGPRRPGEVRREAERLALGAEQRPEEER